MKYFQLAISSDPKVIGVNNGIYQIELDENVFSDEEDIRDLKSKFSYNNFDGLKDVKKKPIRMKLVKNAKLTDFMGFSPYLDNVNFAISKRALSILEKSALKDFEIVPLAFPYNIVKEPYFLFCYTLTPPEYIYFNSSKIYTGDDRLNNKIYHSLSNWEHYRDFKKNHPLSSFEKLVLDSSEQRYDLLSLIAGGMFLSENLENLMEENRLTGLNIVKNKTSVEFLN